MRESVAARMRDLNSILQAGAGVSEWWKAGDRQLRVCGAGRGCGGRAAAARGRRGSE